MPATLDAASDATPSAVPGWSAWFADGLVIDDGVVVPDVGDESEMIVVFSRSVAFGVGVLGVA